MNPEDFRSELHEAISATPPDGLEARLLAAASMSASPRRDRRFAGTAPFALAIVVLLAAGLGAAIVHLRDSERSAVVASPTGSPQPTFSPEPTPSPLPSPSPAASPTGSPLVILPTQLELSVASANVVWAKVGGISGELLFSSADGGATWTRRSLPSAGQTGMNDMSFVPHEGWLLGAGPSSTQCVTQSVSLLRTSDDGATWEPLNQTGIATAQCKQGLSFVDTLHGYLAAWDDNHRPLIYRTQDGGLSWAASSALPDPPGQTTQPGGNTLQPGPVRKFGTDLLVGAVGWQHAYFYRSGDGGATWSHLATAPGANHWFPSLMDATHWWLGDMRDDPTGYTTDAGAHWITMPGHPDSAAPVPPVFTFVDMNVGYATVRGSIYRTTDGGHTWTGIPTPGT